MSDGRFSDPFRCRCWVLAGGRIPSVSSYSHWCSRMEFLPSGLARRSSGRGAPSTTEPRRGRDLGERLRIDRLSVRFYSHSIVVHMYS